MTKEEAIKRFETLLLHVDTDCVMGMETTEAIKMAIKALKQPEPCEDAVSREAAIDAIISFFKLTDYNESAYAVRTVLGDLPPAQPELHWIPCSERLPEVKQKVLVQYADGSMATKRCNDAGHLQWFYSNAVAWIPAPEPWEGDAE